MTLHKRWAGIALLGMTALAGPAIAHNARTAAAPPIQHRVAVRTSAVNAAPDAGESFDSDAGDIDSGLEAREAIGAVAPSQSAMGGPAAPPATLNAQYAQLRTSIGLAPAPVAIQLAFTPAADASAAAVPADAAATAAAGAPTLQMASAGMG